MLAAIKMKPNYEEVHSDHSTPFPRTPSVNVRKRSLENAPDDDTDTVRKIRLLKFLKKELEASRTVTEREVILGFLLQTCLQTEPRGAKMARR